ncbi:MAG: sulfotransferase [Planctomycetes bacterium]|nr:sulfotransferase [Planctomycetota bacterium]
MLRDILTQLPGYATWPCDEINYIWRHGNRDFPTDAIPPERATEPLARWIQARFAQIQRRSGAHTVVEKTCANTLRVPFVAACLPAHALFLEIVRDGRDVACSAAKRWTASLDLNYLWKKAKWVPKSDLPYYATRYLAARLHRLRSKERRVSTWGPRYEGMEEDLRRLPLIEACAQQWEECVLRCRDGLQAVPEERRLSIRYEDFVQDPLAGMATIARFLGEEWSADQLQPLLQGVRAGSVGNWKKQLDPETADRMEFRHAEALAWAASLAPSAAAPAQP